MPFELPEPYLIAAEQQLGARLPPPYRAAMLASNGGEIEVEDDVWILYPIADNSDRKRIARTCNHVIRETERWREWSGFPTNAIAIGENQSGDVLVLLQSGDKFLPSVHVWSHETRQLDEVAEDFRDLL
jgi:SMI1/KNR4 family protein SUKH-1